MEEFNKWENFIMVEENKLITIRLLVEHGKNDLKDSVYYIMRRLMTNKVAVNFNLKECNRKGVQIEKNKFVGTRTYDLVIAALKLHKKERVDRGIDFFYNKETADFHIAKTG
ncbi:uncharacterized protein LOC116852622 [Odontomachus brunneus]|uniref:uncharacterized protein LOC116852622 n=1 Tax=Odontomachus brunneus TaxID=486640 RepID=UPI0013F25FAE|nr:uncharacterized protein LOC116852622 [Odontomachus brunneus]